ncbi:hypothetical protein DFH08DRAFT_933091 [Mycena albidolilacea]|uniref:Uncharacterized protein n=1 Tax=Mycena albidolilacea TaxID=1033008 RepID=A0AAD7AFI2_9AGAR|nr:hypothetical protein DFH08DRAFT_933091 [Mycena albidolilacea]
MSPRRDSPRDLDVYAPLLRFESGQAVERVTDLEEIPIIPTLLSPHLVRHIEDNPASSVPVSVHSVNKARAPWYSSREQVESPTRLEPSYKLGNSPTLRTAQYTKIWLAWPIKQLGSRRAFHKLPTSFSVGLHRLPPGCYIPCPRGLQADAAQKLILLEEECLSAYSGDPLSKDRSLMRLETPGSGCTTCSGTHATAAAHRCYYRGDDYSSCSIGCYRKRSPWRAVPCPARKALAIQSTGTALATNAGFMPVSVPQLPSTPVPLVVPEACKVPMVPFRDQSKLENRLGEDDANSKIH